MEWELSQEFIFEANAHEVVTYFMGSNEWQGNRLAVRTMEVKDGQFILRAWLSAMPGVRALYSIGITGGTRAGTEFYSEEAYLHSILSASIDLGEIALRQIKAGECVASLYLESDPRRLGSDHTSLWAVTPQLLGILWNRLIGEWLQRPQVISPTPVDPSAIGTRAKSLGMQIGRLERWDRITQSYYPQGLTQRRIAEIEMVSTVAIRNDFRDMREHGLLPPVGPKSTP